MITSLFQEEPGVQHTMTKLFYNGVSENIPKHSASIQSKGIQEPFGQHLGMRDTALKWSTETTVEDNTVCFEIGGQVSDEEDEQVFNYRPEEPDEMHELADNSTTHYWFSIEWSKQSGAKRHRKGWWV
jgi:hypothetical protein